MRLHQIFQDYMKQIPLYQNTNNYQPATTQLSNNYATNFPPNVDVEQETDEDSGGRGTIKGLRQQTNVPRLTKNGKP